MGPRWWGFVRMKWVRRQASAPTPLPLRDRRHVPPAPPNERPDQHQHDGQQRPRRCLAPVPPPGRPIWILGSSHFFAFTGAHVSRSLSGTGLTSVSSFALSAPYVGSASEPLTFTFSINGSDVGSWTLAAGDGPSTDSLAHSFAPVSPVARSYMICLRVTAPVCSGCGSFILSENSPLHFTWPVRPCLSQRPGR